MCKVLLNTINKVRVFCDLAKSVDCELTLHSGKYVVDAKSIMGIFSLDLCKPADLYVENTEELDTVKAKFAEFIV